MWSSWRAWCFLSLACTVFGQRIGGRIDQDTMLSSRPMHLKNQELPKQDEPSCDQLKAIWRIAKRQARAPEIMNEVNTYQDPLIYNTWPVYTALPRAAPRFRYQYQVPRETFGRVVTKAPPNVVRTPDYDEMFGRLHLPGASGKILRFPGPSKTRGPPTTFMVPPQRDRFEALKKLIRDEHIRELHRKYETEQKQELKDLALGRGGEGGAFANYEFSEEPRVPQPIPIEYAIEEQNSKPKKPPVGSRQFSRYSDVMLPPARRTYYHPYFDYIAPEFIPYVY